MANPFFNFYQNNQEFDLYNKLADEMVETFGIQVYYMPRNVRKTDMLFGEDVGSYFTSDTSFEVTVYLEDPLSFGEDEVYAKFGISTSNRCTLFIQQDRLRNAIKGEPFFGDLIYIPMFNRLFEVMNPEEKTSFFLFGRLMTFALKCELIKYSQEKINVGIPELDDLYGNATPTLSLQDNKADADVDIVATINFDEDNPFAE